MYKGAFVTEKGHVVGIPKTFNIINRGNTQIYIYNGNKAPHQLLSNITDNLNVMKGIVMDLKRKVIATIRYNGSITILNKMDIKEDTDIKELSLKLLEEVVIQ